MNWEIKSLDDNYQVIDYDNKKPVIVGYDGNTEKVLYIDVDKNTFLRSSADDESEEELTLGELKSGKLDQIPEDVISKYLELLEVPEQPNDQENKSSEKPDNEDSLKPTII